MIVDNICKFIPAASQNEDIQILNFVYETQAVNFHGLHYETVYKMHLVASGSGTLHVLGHVYPLSVGTLFFTFPSMSYSIESTDALQYMYISYIGFRSNHLMEKLNISRNRFIFSDMESLLSIWQSSILDDKAILHLRCEGILLYSFSILGEQLIKTVSQDDSIVLKIKKYIDENFPDRSLSLHTISDVFSYNPKYLSTIFKEKFHIGISKYITTLRIQQAYTLMEQGFTSIKDIAFQCGFSDPAYFSKVFKEHMGVSPSEYISNDMH